jgi:hypothetical protein
VEAIHSADGLFTTVNLLQTIRIAYIFLGVMNIWEMQGRINSGSIPCELLSMVVLKQQWVNAEVDLRTYSENIFPLICKIRPSITTLYFQQITDKIKLSINHFHLLKYVHATCFGP